MQIAIIGTGAIGQYVAGQMHPHAWVVRPERVDQTSTTPHVARIADLPTDIDLVIDCAGHAALAAHGPHALRRGCDVITVSIGALADQALHDTLTRAADEGGAQLHLATGAIGALDALSAARVGGLDRVIYTGRKPPKGWAGSAAETVLDLSALTTAQVHFDGTARAAALAYPKNANVAAAVALAGVGFDQTAVKLIADPGITSNIHEIQASGPFGSFSFQIEGRTLPDNPRTSALAAMSVVTTIQRKRMAITF